MLFNYYIHDIHLKKSYYDDSCDEIVKRFKPRNYTDIIDFFWYIIEASKNRWKISFYLYWRTWLNINPLKLLCEWKNMRRNDNHLKKRNLKLPPINDMAFSNWAIKTYQIVCRLRIIISILLWLIIIRNAINCKV